MAQPPVEVLMCTISRATGCGWVVSGRTQISPPQRQTATWSDEVAVRFHNSYYGMHDRTNGFRCVRVACATAVVQHRVSHTK